MAVNLSGSLVITGSITTTGVITMSGSIASASYSSNSDLLQGTGSVGFTTTASFNEISSSQQQISSSLLQVSASYIALSGSYNTFSGSASTRVTQIENVYATTGSNSFRANQSITGSLVVSSTITAQTLVVQTVTSSILYSSGSNNFGNQLSNNQTFTGSVNITGSLALAGNITVNGSINTTDGFYSSKAGSDTIAGGAYIQFTNAAFIQANAGLGLDFWTLPTGGGGWTQRMRLTNGGNFLIGTTTDNGQKLQVQGNSTVWWNNDVFVGMQYIDGSEYRNGFLFSSDNRSTGIIAKAATGSTPYIWFGTGITPTERMRIASSGKVSISAPTTADAFTVQGANNYWTSILTSGTTTSQAYGLYVKAGTNGSDVPFLIQNTSGTDILRILGTGNVGIGTTPSYILQTKDAGITVQNTYFGTGQVRVGGGSDHGASTVFSVAPGVVTFDRPGVGGGALTIDSSGYVTLPAQPSFTAVGNSAWTTYSSFQVIVFQLTRYNNASAYNTSTGKFTAPVAGKYFFTINMYFRGSIAASIQLTINGSSYVPSDLVPLIYRDSTIPQSSAGFTMLLDLSANDYVEVRARSGNTPEIYMSHSHFSGALLS